MATRHRRPPVGKWEYCHRHCDKVRVPSDPWASAAPLIDESSSPRSSPQRHRLPPHPPPLRDRPGHQQRATTRSATEKGRNNATRAPIPTRRRHHSGRFAGRGTLFFLLRRGGLPVPLTQAKGVFTCTPASACRTLFCEDEGTANSEGMCRRRRLELGFLLRFELSLRAPSAPPVFFPSAMTTTASASSTKAGVAGATLDDRARSGPSSNRGSIASGPPLTPPKVAPDGATSSHDARGSLARPFMVTHARRLTDTATGISD